jgi:hypothetical protein
MKNWLVLMAIGVPALVAAACSEPEPLVTLPVFDGGPAMGVVANDGRHAAVPLSGDEEVPPRDTHARGTAIFQLSADGTTLDYKLIVANIENVVAAHIHIAPAGVNGPVGVFLYGPAPAGGGRIDGVIAEGSILAASFIGPLSGMTMDDLIAAMVAGNAYVNVHTNDGIAPIDTGPGDFPGGEVRGQIR